jgi:hypothetical protein
MWAKSFPLGIYTDAQTELTGFGTASVPPHRTIVAKLVGIVIDPTTVAQDDVDTGTALQIFTPALTQQCSRTASTTRSPG